MTARPWAELLAWLAAAAGLVGTGILAYFVPSAFPHAWLAAYTTWAGWPLGCIGLLLIHALTGGDWGYATRIQLLAGASTLALLPLGIIPLIFVARDLYPWLRPDIAAHLNNTFYLNLPAFTGRLIGYFVIWFALAFAILISLRRGGPSTKLAWVAPIGLILLAVTITYAAIDSTMSMEPHFVSSDYGLITIVGMGLFALSISAFAAAIAQPPASKTLRNIGRLLLALAIFWAYLDFVQLLIIWQSDLPNEATWYILRSTGGWGIVAAGIAAGHFFLPFFILLSPKVQQTRLGIACASAFLILSGVVRGWWIIIPESGRGIGASEVLAMVGAAGIAAALAFHAARILRAAAQVDQYV
ncbi:MAG: hypothetical protein J2P49_00880 [Methylocapsa sp.]|nr:hypothetical protein [Methylocapsa sp.]